MMDQGRGKRRVSLAIPRLPSNGVVHRLAYMFLICSLQYDLVSPSHPTEGVLMRRMRTGRDAAPAGSASSTKPPGASGVTARPNYVGPSGNGPVERMNAGRNPCGMIVIGGGRCPFQKAVPRSKENAVVGRREARRSALWAGSSLPQEGQVSP